MTQSPNRPDQFTIEIFKFQALFWKLARWKGNLCEGRRINSCLLPPASVSSPGKCEACSPSERRAALVVRTNRPAAAQSPACALPANSIGSSISIPISVSSINSALSSGKSQLPFSISRLMAKRTAHSLSCFGSPRRGGLARNERCDRVLGICTMRANRW